MPLLSRQFRAGINTVTVRSRLHGATPNGQRIRIGVTMLAGIFLIVLGAAAGIRPDRSMAPAGAQGDPLAQLGVAPSSAHEAAQRSDALAAKPSRI